MKNGRIVAITGFLIVLALFSYSYYANKASVPPLTAKEDALSTAPANKEPASSTATDNKQVSPGYITTPSNNAADKTAAPENKASGSPETAVVDKAPVSSAAAIEQAKKDGESMWLLFRSTTCIPCVEMQKVFDQLEADYKGKVRFIAIDVNDRNNMAVLRTWKIQYIPTSFIIDSTGKVSYQNVGVIPNEDLKKELNKVVK